MYKWIVFLHVISAFLFMMAHGAAAAVMFRVRREQDLDRARFLIELSRFMDPVSYISLLLLLGSGLALGFMGGWWGRGWIWAAIGALVVMIGLMGYLGRGYFDAIVKRLQPSDNPGHVEPVSHDEMETLLGRGRPVLTAAIGIGGWLVIVWLMMFKPF